MKNILTLFLLPLFILNLKGQESYISLRVNNIVEMSCPFDSTVIISQIKDWIIYQTLDNSWDGEIDSSRCIGARREGYKTFIDIEGIDKTKALFIRRKITEENKFLLYPDYLYDTYTDLNFSEEIELKYDTECLDEVCTGLIIGIDIRNEEGSGRGMRYYTAAYDGSSRLNLCIPTEYFSDNYLKEFILKITFEESSSDSGWVQTFGGEIQQNFDRRRIYEVLVDESHYETDRYIVSPSELTVDGWGLGSFQLMYRDTTKYPSFQNTSYIDAQPVPNTDMVETIDIELWGESLIPQPYTVLRGALIIGSDSLRHQVNVLNNGGNICISFIELIFEGNTHYYHHSGTINLDGHTGCMMFMYGGSMNIGVGASLEYGNVTGDGALALGKNGHLNLAKNSEMMINNRFVLMEKSIEEDEQAYVDLQKGSHLIFGENAVLEKNTRFPNGQMKLNVYMNGGTLDESQLSEEERKLIRKIYPPSPLALIEDIVIAPNPTTEYIFADIPMSTDGEIHMELYNMAGQTIQQWDMTAAEGNQAVKVALKSQTKGVFLLKVTTKTVIGQQFIRKVFLY